MMFAASKSAIVLAERAITAIFMAVIVALVFVAAASRYLGTPINWSVDLAQAMFVWIVFLGASIAMRQERHIGVSLFVDILPPFWRRITTVLGNLIVMAFLASIFVYGIRVSAINVGRQLTSIPISYSFVTIAASVGALLMFLTLMGRTVQLVWQKPADEGSRP